MNAYTRIPDLNIPPTSAQMWATVYVVFIVPEYIDQKMFLVTVISLELLAMGDISPMIA